MKHFTFYILHSLETIGHLSACGLVPTGSLLLFDYQSWDIIKIVVKSVLQLLSYFVLVVSQLTHHINKTISSCVRFTKPKKRIYEVYESYVRLVNQSWDLIRITRVGI